MKKLAGPLLASIVSLLVAASMTTAAHATAVTDGTPAVATAANEFTPAYATGYLTYSSNSTGAPKKYNEYVLPDGGSRFKVNPSGTFGFGGGIDGTTLAYQLVSRTGSDVALYDVSTKSALPTPPGLDTRWWEWAPSLSGNYVLFNRNNINMAKRQWQKVVLFNTSTDASTTLKMVKSGKPFLSAGEVNGNYATWTMCTRTCNVYLYDIGAKTTTKIPNPSGSPQYYPAVTADGTVYFAASGSKCGASVKILREPLASSPTTIVNVSHGYDVQQSINVFTNPDTSVTLFYPRMACFGNYYSDIYTVANADTLAVTSTPKVPAAPSSAVRFGRFLTRPAGWAKGA
jgi:hypothetical protein